MDGTAGGHKIAVARAASLAGDLRPSNPTGTEQTYRPLWYGRGS